MHCCGQPQLRGPRQDQLGRRNDNPRVVDAFYETKRPRRVDGAQRRREALDHGGARRQRDASRQEPGLAGRRDVHRVDRDRSRKGPVALIVPHITPSGPVARGPDVTEQALRIPVVVRLPPPSILKRAPASGGPHFIQLPDEVAELVARAVNLHLCGNQNYTARSPRDPMHWLIFTRPSTKFLTSKALARPHW